MKNRWAVLAATVCSSAILLGAAALPAEAQNLLKDPGFESRLSPDQGGWRMFGPSRISADHARQGDGSMLNGATSKSVTYPPYFIGTVSGSYQEFPASPGSRWRLTGYGLTPAKLLGTPAYGIVQISFFDARGRDLGTVETADSSTAKAKLSNEINNRSRVGEWVFLDTGIATAPEGTSTIQAFTIYIDYSGSSVFQGVYFDDLSLCTLDADNVEPACDPPGTD